MQHREWNPKAFFRKLSPNIAALIGQRFNVNLGAESGDGVDAAYNAWKAAPAKSRRSLDHLLGLVNDLSGTHARAYLDDLAKVEWATTPELITQSRDWSAQDLAARLSLIAPAAVTKLHQQYMVEMMEHLTEYRGKRQLEIKASARTKKAMADAMSEHFRENAGGARCQVEDYEGPDKFALFIHHEDEVTAVDKFNEQNQIVPDWQRPVVQIAAVFYPDVCTLMVKAPKKVDREKLRDLFAQIFVGEKDFFEDVSGEPTFDFSSLKRVETSFRTKPADKVADVGIAKLVLKAPQVGVKRIVFEFAGLSIEGVRDALSKRGLQLAEADIDAAHLLFRFAEVKGRAQYRTVSMYRPNRSNLRDTARDRMIRRYLKEWRIDARHSAFRLAAPSNQVG